MSAKEQKPAPKPTPLKTLRLLVGKREGEKPPVFRPEQKTVVDQILKGRDVLAIFPTGSGKSVCYQVPALHLEGLTLVITPLLALMQDQVTKLNSRLADHIRADYGCDAPVACLSSDFIFDRDGMHHSKRSKDGRASPSFRTLRNQIYLDAAAGKYKFLYVTPERLRQGHFIRFARRANISMIAVDEAHCISLWGHDFRRQYLEILRLLGRTGQRPILAAFTATATQAVRQDILQLLEMRRCKVVEILDRETGRIRPREELDFSVRHFATHKQRLRALLRFLRQQKGAGDWPSGFIYCRTKDDVQEVYEFLAREGLPVTRYHAKLDAPSFQVPGESKSGNFRAFMSGKKPIVVSTTALGMGIDKPDIRFVIHVGLPLSLEDYYQQAGRAGRDGEPARCALYYVPGDAAVCESLIEDTFENSLLPPQSRQRHRAIAYQRLGRMLDYAEGGAERSSEELQGQILDYFQSFHLPLQDSQRRAVLSELRAIDVLYVSRTRVAHDLRRGLMEGSALAVGRGEAGEEPPTVSYRVTGEALDYFDLMVADAVYTLLEHRVSPIRATAVMQLLSGSGDLTLQANRRREVEARIRKLTRAQITIERHHPPGYWFTYPDQGKPRRLRGAFLPLTEDPEKAGVFTPDTTAEGAPLYQYSEFFNGQFFSFPTRYLQVPGLAASDRNLLMIHYMLCRIHAMAEFPGKNTGPAGANNTLSFVSMLRDTGLDRDIPQEDPYRRRALRTLWDRAEVILRHFVAAGAIRDYAVKGELRSFLIYRQVDENGIID